jgi:hypothetical protein
MKPPMAKGGHSKHASSSAAMREAWRLFDAGDVKLARRAADEVLRGLRGPTPPTPPTPEEKAEAEDLLARTAFPREALKIAALAATLIVALLVIAALRG